MAENPPIAPPQLGLSDVLLQQEEEKTELDKVLQLLLDPKNIAHNTELGRNEIMAFSVLGTMATRHDLPVLKEFLFENKILRVSKGRQGRKEWVKITSRQLMQSDQDQASERTGIRRFFRR